MDTLAGLAVKYHVEVNSTSGELSTVLRNIEVLRSDHMCLQVADIKRANGLLSDSAMFAKDTLLIPTRSLPVG